MAEVNENDTIPFNTKKANMDSGAGRLALARCNRARTTFEALWTGRRNIRRNLRSLSTHPGNFYGAQIDDMPKEGLLTS
jgi:hypothetical protein